MKKIYLLIFFALVTIQLHAQWTSFSVPAVTNLFRCVYFLNPDTGYLIGEFVAPDPSPILRTTDAGATFSNNNSSTQKALRAIQFIDADTGYVVGFDGKLLHSTDGGIVWDSLVSGTIQHLRSIHFPSHNTGYICGGLGTVLKTTDAGKNWTSMNVATVTDLINIRFVSDDTGYVVAAAGTFDNGTIYKTIDGGTTWTSVYSDPLIGFLGLAVVDANTVYAGGKDDVIVKTTDGGANWTTVNTGLTGHNIRSAFALDANTVWMGCDIGDIFYTNDGGGSWTNQSVNTNGIFSIYFTSPTTGYACGSAGEVLVYGIGLGLNEIPSPSILEISPNPLTNSAVIFIAGNSSHQVLSISDVQGKIIREISVNAEERVTLEKKDFAEGIYFISLLNDQRQVIAKSKLLVQ